MNRTVTAFVSIVSHAERIWTQIDWQEVRYILWQGIKGFVALTILTAILVTEYTVATYKWTQPRLAAILQHPGQTLRNGPATLYGECLVGMFTGTANPAERIIVRIGAFVILTVHTFKDTIAAIKQWQDSLTVATVSTWAREQLMG